MFRRRPIRRLQQQIAPPCREDVSAQYWRELNDLLAEGEVSLEVAKRLERDMFERAIAGKPRRLNDRAWEIVLDGRRADLDREMARATEGPRTPLSNP